MSVPENNRTPFDEGLDTPSPASPGQVSPHNHQPRPLNSRHWLSALWDLPRANLMAMAAAGGALAVVVLSGLIGHFMPHATQPPTAMSHGAVPTLDASRLDPKHKLAIGEVGSNGGVPLVQTEVMPPSPADYTSVSHQTEDINLNQPLTDEDRKRLEEHRREDQIMVEKRLLEDKKRAIERQIEDKQIEEQRVTEDKKRLEDREQEDKKIADDKAQEEKRKLEDEQRKLDDEQRKIAQAH